MLCCWNDFLGRRQRWSCWVGEGTSANQNLDDFPLPAGTPGDQKCVYPLSQPPKVKAALGLLTPNKVDCVAPAISFLFFTLSSIKPSCLLLHLQFSKWRIATWRVNVCLYHLNVLFTIVFTLGCRKLIMVEGKGDESKISLSKQVNLSILYNVGLWTGFST